MFVIDSPAFTNGADIPSQYTCEDRDISPELRWSGVPANAKSLALIVDDPDAPDPKAPKKVFVHWVLYNIPVDSKGLPEAVTADKLPQGTKQGMNDWHRVGWGGPCPPIGKHRYFFKLFALDTVLEPLTPGTKTQLETAMQGHILDQATLFGTYIMKNPK